MAGRALGAGALPGASVAASLAMEDAGGQGDSRDDTQVTKMQPGLSKRQSWNFPQQGFLSSLLTASSLALRSLLQLGQVSHILFYFI